MPRNQQVDNEMVFYGSRRYPRGMGPLLRLCLLHQIEVWFIPMREPWRNGVVEKFNDLWQQKFLGRIDMVSETALRSQDLLFEERHNTRYRYSKLNGKTPMETLKASGVKLRFPPQCQAPRHPLPKPEIGRHSGAPRDVQLGVVIRHRFRHPDSAPGCNCKSEDRGFLLEFRFPTQFFHMCGKSC